MSGIDDFIGKAGEPVPAVDVADIKVMWTYLRELEARHPKCAVGVNIWKQVCRPGADIPAVFYRCSMLRMLEMIFRAAWTGGELSENALKVAARMDLGWMPVGVVQNGFPFNLEGFLAEVQREAA